MSSVGVKVSAAYQAYTVACDNLRDAMAEESRAKALEYFRSEQRPVDEAKREAIKGIAEQMGNCIKKRALPDEVILRRWIEVLWSI